MVSDCSNEIFHNLLKVNKPYRYIGKEYLSFNKKFDSAKVRLALVFPDKYEIAISNIAHKILYETVNSVDDFMADRVYAPDIDYLKVLEENGSKLTSLESERNLSEFDLLGFSLQYELCYPTILKMLELSDIPIKSDERKDDSPILFAGGPCCFNPAPLSKYIDLFIIGDGDELIIEIMQTYQKLKANGASRDSIIRELSNLEGIYSPKYPKCTKKRVSPFVDIKTKHYSPIPYSSSVQDRVVAEIRRGCGRMCRFCQSGHINLPIRERRAKDIIEFTKSAVELTGYNECSLLSLASNDYSNIVPVIEELTSVFNNKKVSISLPSQRIDSFNYKLAELMESNRNKSVTLAIEAGSQRLRDVINKNIDEKQILDTLMICYKQGISTFKLYFMLGLPTETLEDIDEMVELLSKIKYCAHGIRNEFQLKEPIKLNLSISIFVPKPFTPFQWCGQETEENLKIKIRHLMDKAKTLKGVKISYHDFVISKFEALFARGDNKVGDFIYKLYEQGVYLSSWSENVDKELWYKIAQDCGFSIDEEATKNIPLNSVLPWQDIFVGIDDNWFKEQYRLAFENKNSSYCEAGCANCGVCKNLNVQKVLDMPYSSVKIEQQQNSDEKVYYRLKLSKLNSLRFISHLDWQNTLIKALQRSGLKLCFSQGFNPTPKISLGVALPIFVESLCEQIDVCLAEDVSEEEIKIRFGSVLPDGIKLLNVKKYYSKPEPFDNTVYWAEYKFENISEGLSKNQNLLYIKNVIDSQNEILIEKRNKKGISKLINIKSSIKDAQVRGGALYLVLKTGQSGDLPQVRADEVIKLFDKNSDFRITRLKFYDEQYNEL